MFQKILDKMKSGEFVKKSKKKKKKSKKKKKKRIDKKPQAKVEQKIEPDKLERETKPEVITKIEEKEEVEIPEMLEVPQKKKEKISEEEIQIKEEKKIVPQISEEKMTSMLVEKEEVPLIKFEGNAQAPIIRYDVPSPSSYTGTMYIQTDIGREYFGGDKIFKLDPNLTEEQKAEKKLELFKTIKKRFLKENHEDLKNYLTSISREELEQELDYYSMKEDEIGAELLNRVKLEAARKAVEAAKLKAEQAQTTADQKQQRANTLTNAFAAVENVWKKANTWYASQKKNPFYIWPWVSAPVEAAYKKAKNSYEQKKKELEIAQNEAAEAAANVQEAEQERIRAEERIVQIQGEVATILSLMNTAGMVESQAKYTLFKYLMEIAWKVDNSFPSFTKTMGGKVKVQFAKLRDLEPKLVLVETHKLTNFPGDYGAGTTIKTFSLLPKEETEISIKTWKKSVTTMKEASSILDSYTEEKADEFEKGIQSEVARTSKEENSSSFNVSASGGVSMGCVNASASVGYESGTSSCREDSVKNVMNATSKHAQQASAKREVNVETSFESTEETGEEVTIMRKIENLNASRTLNFTFRQMNQQFHSILHLIDVRIGFYNGYPGSFRVYTLPELSRYVFKYMNITEKTHQEIFNDVKAKILKEYTTVQDYQGNLATLIEEVSNGNGGSYLRVIPPRDVNGKRTGKESYVMRDEMKDSTGAIVQPKDVRYLDGIILANRVITMRTDGVIVEALLGQANALDNFALEARKEKIREDMFLNDLSKANVKKVLAGIKIIESLIANNQYDKAINAYKEIFNIEEGIKNFAEMFNHSGLLIQNKSK
jgi:hypothetical protein